MNAKSVLCLLFLICGSAVQASFGYANESAIQDNMSKKGNTAYSLSMNVLWKSALTKPDLRFAANHLTIHGVLTSSQILDWRSVSKVDGTQKLLKTTDLSESESVHYYYKLKQGVWDLQKAYCDYKESLTGAKTAKHFLDVAQIEVSELGSDPALLQHAQTELEFRMKNLDKSQKRLLSMLDPTAAGLIADDFSPEVK
jgi:hypothetical protein